MLRPRRVHLLPPVSYQGGKRRQAPEIVRHMALDPETPFFELCCGSGAVSLELISRGHNPAKITMVDAGPWGIFWETIANGTYKPERLAALIQSLPLSNPYEIKEAMRAMRDKGSPKEDVPYVFPLLQLAAFGGNPVGWEGGKWKMHGFAPHHPVKTNYLSRTQTLLRSVGKLAARLRGVRVIHGKVEDVAVPRVAAVYLDPPYEGTWGYSHSVGAAELANALGVACFVSERVPLNDTARRLRPRLQSGVNHSNERDRSEYLSLFNADWPTPDYARVEQLGIFG